MKKELYTSPVYQEITGYTIRPGGLEITKEAADYCCFNPDSKILDIGSGYGESLAFLKSQYKLDVYGLEPSEKMRQQCKLRHKDLNITSGDASLIPFSDNYFDGIFIECVFSLVEDKNIALTEIKRVLRPNGYFIISDVYLREKNQANQPSMGCGCFDNAMCKQAIIELLNKYGFELRLFEDESKYLKDIAIKIIMGGGSLLEFQKAIGLKSENDTCTRLLSKPGYFLLVSKNIK